MNAYLNRLSDRALEMVMRDVLDGLEEIALDRAMRSGMHNCLILSIEPARKQDSEAGGSTNSKDKVVDFASYKKAAGFR